MNIHHVYVKYSSNVAHTGFCLNGVFPDRIETVATFTHGYVLMVGLPPSEHHSSGPWIAPLPREVAGVGGYGHRECAPAAWASLGST